MCRETSWWGEPGNGSWLAPRQRAAPDYAFVPPPPRVAPPRPHEASELEFLFRQCRNPVMGIAGTEYDDSAAELKVEVAAIKAVARVETKGKAFDNLGRPTILFERHHFHRLTSGSFDSDHPQISNAVAGGYGKLSTQYEKLEEAFRLDAEAALKSASWGRFQIMGSNHKASGFSNVAEFVLAHVKNESSHLAAFVSFVGSNKKRLKALREKDWAAFARMYNGAGYAKQGYHLKMQAAYDELTAAP